MYLWGNFPTSKLSGSCGHSSRTNRSWVYDPLLQVYVPAQFKVLKVKFQSLRSYISIHVQLTITCLTTWTYAWKISSLWGNTQSTSCMQAALAAQIHFFVCSTRYPFLELEWEVCLTLLHNNGSGNWTPDLSILSLKWGLKPYLLCQILPISFKFLDYYQVTSVCIFL